MIISLGGTPGSGKSTVGKILAEKLGYEFMSMGQIRRKYAMDKGMTLQELNELSIKDPDSDNLVDEYQKELGKNDDFIIDSRLSWFFIPKAFKIWITVSDEEGARRIFSHNREEEKFDTEEQIISRNKERIEEDSLRFQNLYNINDYTAEVHYDFIIDTTNISAEEAANIILEEIKKT